MPSTIRDLTELTTVAVDDYILISDTSDVTNRDKRISRLNLIGGALTGGGTVATGGFTLTVPATGTAGLLGVAQTFTALKTFTAGINVSSVVSSFYEEGTWTPTVRFGAASVGQSYSTRSGTYTRIGNRVFCTLNLTLSAKGTSTGTVDISGLPFTVGQSSITSPRWTNTSTNFINMFLIASAGGTVLAIRALTVATFTGGVAIADTDIAANCTFIASFSYDV